MNYTSEQQSHSDCAQEIEALRDEHRKIYDAIRQNNTTREYLYAVNRLGIGFSPLTRFIMMWVIEFFVVLFTIYYAVTNPPIELFLVLVFIGVLIALLNLLLVYPKVRKKKKLDADNKKLYAELRKIEERINALKSESYD